MKYLMPIIHVALCAFLVVILSGCGPKPEDFQQPNQCIRAELFKSCMSVLPAGPVATHYNDWAEVVQKCENSSYYQSLRVKRNIPQECRAH